MLAGFKVSQPFNSTLWRLRVVLSKHIFSRHQEIIKNASPNQINAEAHLKGRGAAQSEELRSLFRAIKLF